MGKVRGREKAMQLPEDLQTRYFERRKRDLQECLLQVTSSNFRYIEKVGHQLKGNGITFGFPELSEIGMALELAAQSGTRAEILAALGELSRWVESHLS